MPVIICELCGSNDIQKQDGLYVCQHCGTKYTVEEAKKLIRTAKTDLPGNLKIREKCDNRKERSSVTEKKQDDTSPQLSKILSITSIVFIFLFSLFILINEESSPVFSVIGFFYAIYAVVVFLGVICSIICLVISKVLKTPTKKHVTATIFFCSAAVLYIVSFFSLKQITANRPSSPTISYSASFDPSSSSLYGSTTSTTYRTTDRSRDAWVCAIGYVQDNLKSPSTAKFCKYTDATVMRVGEDEYIIHGYVDAQNSLGAGARQVWTVSLFLTEKGFRDPYLEWG